MAEPVAAAEMTDGPYYTPDMPFRRDIRDGAPGVNLLLKIKLVDADSGEPLEGMVFDIWHSDATGHYSGYDFDPDEQPKDVTNQKPTNGDIFLRGRGTSDAEGDLEFLTIFPGWYASRAPHIHVKVSKPDGTCCLTSQLYLPETVCQQVYENEPAYARKVEQDTFNRTDTVIALTPDPIDGCWVEIERAQDGFVGRSVLAVDTGAVSRPMQAPPGFQPPLGGIEHMQKVR